MWQLIINGPGYFEMTYDLPDGVTQVGRADENDIVLSGDLVSRKHCRIHGAISGVRFEDLGSRNGTKLNGEPVKGTVDLAPGDVIQIGDNSLKLHRAAQSETQSTDLVDMAGGGRIKRFGRGVDINEAVLAARDISSSNLRRVLDNVAPFDAEPPPVADEAMAQTPRPDVTPPDVELSSRVTTHSLMLMYRVAEAMARADSLQRFLDETCDLVMERVNATTGVVLLRHPTGVMVPAAVRHAGTLKAGEVPVSDGVLDAALSKGQAIAVANVQDDTRFKERESVLLYGVDQVLAIPIGTKAPFAGVLYLNRTRNANEPLDALLDVCTAITQLLESGVAKFSAPGEAAGSAAKGGRLEFSLERLFAPEVAKRYAAEFREGAPLPAVQEATATVLYAELFGLQAAAPKLQADKLTGTVAQWQKLASQLLMSFEGTIESVTAHSVRAVFGVPGQKGDDAIRAVRAAMALKAEWEKLSATRTTKERFAVRAGLTTGRVFGGVVGTEARLDCVLLGEPVQLTQLLCESAEAGQVLITGKTLAHVGARFDVTPLGERALAGQKVKAAVFDVLDEDSDSGTLSGIR